MALKPLSRLEKFLAKIAGNYNDIQPLNRLEFFLDDIGFDNQFISQSYSEEPTEDSVAYTFSHKEMEEYNKQCDKFEKLLDNNVNYELSKIILESYQKKIKENNLVDIFNQEKEKLIDIFTKMKMKLSTDEEKNSKNKEDLKNLKEQEINKYNSLIEEMENIDIEFVDTKFEEYLKDIDTDSFAYSKFDVILYLYQNDYI